MKTSFLFLALLLAVLTTIGQNNPPVAVNDTVNGVVGNPVYVTQSFLLQNDYDPDGDSIFIKHVFGFQKVNDTTWSKNINPYSTDTIIKARYIIKDEHNTNSTVTDNIIIRIKGAVRFDSLDVNNINALISPVGQHFWDFETAHFEVPKGSGKHSVFSHTVWIGGINDGDTLCTAAECYRQTGADFFVGPITNGFDSNYYINWNRVWKLDKEQIRYHINNWNQPAYSSIDAIKNWPANGDIALGQSPQIAPFYDKNTNGTYEPMQGDYPLIRGDQAVFFVFNDVKNIHTESKGYPLGIEIHGMAYGYNRPDDSTLNNTLFMHYDIINRSESNYHDTYFGFFTDFDLGLASDDFIGSDVTNGMMYCYNGTSTDGTGQPASYGEHPPAIGLKVIGGPFLEPDGIDNPSGECGYSLNGLNFGDNVVDNERFGMTNFFCLNNSGNWYMTDPEVAIQYYNYMISYWMDGTQMLYGGNGHITTGGVGPECNFMFPGNSDTICNLGTNGIPPNGGYNQNGYYWTENTTGNEPGDRRGVASVGPFNFSAGETVPLDYCFSWARDYQGDNNSSVELLRDRIAALTPDWNYLANIPLTYYGVPENTKGVSHLVYPNPVHKKATIVVEGSSKQPYQLYSITGELILHGILNPGNNLLDISTLKPGVYILKSGSRNMRIVKM
jgi:hypothetical protein